MRGFRNAIKQAKAGRVVTLIDCTNLLNLRHLHDRDRRWETPYPLDDDEIMGFDDVRTYTGCEDGKRGKYAIVTYGNGVVTALQARKCILDQGRVAVARGDVDVVDCPYLSSVPQGLKEIIEGYNGVVFAGKLPSIYFLMLERSAFYS